MADLVADKAELSNLIDLKNSEIVRSRDDNDEKELKISRLDSSLEEAQNENDKLVRRINQLEALVLDYKIDIESFQEQIDDHATFISNNTCLNPLVFWSGYILAVLIGMVKGLQ